MIICWVGKVRTDHQIEKIKAEYEGSYEGVSPCGKYHIFKLKKEPKDAVEKIGNIPMAWHDGTKINRPSGLSLAEDMNAEVCGNQLARYIH